MWALLAEPPGSPIVTVDHGPGSSVWGPSLLSALSAAEGVYLTRASLSEGLDGLDRLSIERSLDASSPLRAMTTWLLGYHRRLPLDSRHLAELPPLEAWREANSLVFRGLLEEVDTQVHRQFGHMGSEVVAHRSDLDAQAAIHRLSERIEALSEMLSEAWEAPSWTAPRFDDD